MTRLRQMMLDELERRNYTQSTRRATCWGADFARHFQRSPDQLSLDHVCDYLVELFRVRKPSAGRSGRRRRHWNRCWRPVSGCASAPRAIGG
jgi:hypothetical protein